MTGQFNPWTEIPICGCGCPEEALTILHWLLWSFTNDNSVSFEVEWPAKKQFREWLGLYEDSPLSGLGYLLVYCLGELDLIEHGSSISSAWLTEKGERIRDWLDVNGCNPDNWPEDGPEHNLGN